MKIAVFGLGAVGTVFAVFLKEAGHQVYGITKKEYLPFFKDKKLKITGIWGEHEAILDDITDYIKDLDYDLIFLTVKSYDTETAINQIKNVVKQNTFVIVAQNGYGNYEKVSNIIGKNHTLLARVIFGAKVIEPTLVEITVNADDVRIGNQDKAVKEEDIIKIACILKKAGIPASYAPDIEQILWDKIIYNCALNPLGALLECSYGELAEDENTKDLMNKIIDEIFIATKANNIKLRWDNPEDYIQHFYKNLIPPTAKHYPSMYYDLKSKKRTEIDALNGAVVKLAEEKGIYLPVNDTITKMIKRKEKLNLW